MVQYASLTQYNVHRYGKIAGKLKQTEYYTIKHVMLHMTKFYLLFFRSGIYDWFRPWACDTVKGTGGDGYDLSTLQGRHLPWSSHVVIRAVAEPVVVPFTPGEHRAWPQMFNVRVGEGIWHDGNYYVGKYYTKYWT